MVLYMICVYVAVNFLSQVIFVFLLFLGMVMYANEVETNNIYYIHYNIYINNYYMTVWSGLKCLCPSLVGKQYYSLTTIPG